MSRNQRRAIKLALGQRLKNWVNPSSIGTWGHWIRESPIQTGIYLSISFEECSDTALRDFKEIKIRR